MNIKEYLNESSLSRIWRHIQKHDSGTITAFRDKRDCGDGESYTKGENKARNKVLLASLLKKGYSVTKAKGTYIENYKSPNEKEVGENVFIVIDINDKGDLKETLKKLGKEYEQDSILFIPKGGKEGFLIGTNKCEYGFPGYGKINKLKNPIFGKKGEFFTRINGRPFILKENIQNIPFPNSNMGRYSISILSERGWESHYDENKDEYEK